MNNNNEIIKEYEVNESVLVTYHVLNSLYQQFFARYPKDIGKEVINLINNLRDILENNEDLKGHDIKDSNYFEKVIYLKDKNI